MANNDLSIGQAFQFTCLYLLAIQVPTFLALEAAIANLPLESNPAGLSDIAEFAGQAPAAGIPIALGVSSTDSEHKLKNSQAQAKQTSGPAPSKNSKQRRRQINGNFQSNKGGLSTQQTYSNDPNGSDQKFLEQKLKLLQLIDQLGFDEAIKVFQDQTKSEPEWNSEGGQIQPSNLPSTQPPKLKTKRPKVKFAKTESPPPTLQLTSAPLPQVSESQPQVLQIDASNVEKFSGLNGTLEQTVSMAIPRNQNPNPTNVAAPPHHQTNVYIQQTKFHNSHQDISDKSSTQNEQVVVASPVLAAEYKDSSKDSDDDNDDDDDDIIYDDDRRKPTQEQLVEAISRITVTTQRPKPLSKDILSKALTPSPQRRTTTLPSTTTRRGNRKFVILPSKFKTLVNFSLTGYFGFFSNTDKETGSNLYNSTFN